jgi:hypothetical protein
MFVTFSGYPELCGKKGHNARLHKKQNVDRSQIIKQKDKTKKVFKMRCYSIDDLLYLHEQVFSLFRGTVAGGSWGRTALILSFAL